MKVIRVLEYEGPEHLIRTQMERRAVKVSRVSMMDRLSIHERFVVPNPKPHWWDEVTSPGVEESDPTETK